MCYIYILLSYLWQVELILKQPKEPRLTVVPKPQKKKNISWERFLPKYNKLMESAARRMDPVSPAKLSDWTPFRTGTTDYMSCVVPSKKEKY